MGTSFNSPDVRCPYYRSDKGKYQIACEGLFSGSVTRTYFRRRADFDAVIHRCKTDYWNCPLCEALDGKYREDDNDA